MAKSQNPKTQKSNYAILFLNNFVRKIERLPQVGKSFSFEIKNLEFVK